MPRLTDEHKTFIVQRLAMYDTPSQVAEAVKEEFGVTIDRQLVRCYNPTQVQTAKKWAAIFEATRASFLESLSDIPIAQRSVRLRVLDRIRHKAELNQDYGLVCQILEQVAKEVGDVYTNRQKLEHMGKDGKPFVGGVVIMSSQPPPADGEPLAEIRRIA